MFSMLYNLTLYAYAKQLKINVILNDVKLDTPSSSPGNRLSFFCSFLVFLELKVILKSYEPLSTQL